LPKQARPLFIRLLQPGRTLQKTQTLKFKKATYQREGYNPRLCHGDVIYFLDHRAKNVQKLDVRLFDALCADEIAL
jgi:hypothetical protein